MVIPSDNVEMIILLGESFFYCGYDSAKVLIVRVWFLGNATPLIPIEIIQEIMLG
jgi:hypothetical protein